jgi:hypothetical protein
MFYSLDGEKGLPPLPPEEKTFFQEMREKERKARLKLKEDLLGGLGLLNHPKGNALFDLAWDQLHIVSTSQDSVKTSLLCEKMNELSKLLEDHGDGDGIYTDARPVMGTREEKVIMSRGTRPRLVTTKYEIFMEDGTVVIVTPRVRAAGEEGPSLYLDIQEDKP